MNPLEFEYSRGRGVGEPDGGGVSKNGTDEGLEGYEEGFPLLAPGGASKGFEDTESIVGLVCYCVDVGGKGEVGVKSDTQDTGSPVERQRGA